MKFKASYTIPAPREKVFALITDPTVLQNCIAGCEKMVRTSEDNYDAHLKNGIARIELAEKGQETEVRCDSEAQVGGMIAAIGSRLVEAIGKKMMDDFFKKFAEQVAKS